MTMSYRILQFVPEELPTHRPDVVTLFGKYLPRHGVVCDIVGTNSGKDMGEQGFNSATVSTWHDSRLKRELSYMWLALCRMAGARRASTDLIQVRDMVTVGLLGLVIAKLKGIPYAYWVSYPMSEGRIGRARRELARRRSPYYTFVLCKGLLERALLYKVILRCATHVFVQSDAMRDFMVRQGISAARQTAVPMGVDTELVTRNPVTPRRLPGWENVPVLAYLGSLDRERELVRLLDALIVVRRTVPDARLMLVGAAGTRSDEEELHAHIRANKLEDAVHITGWLPSTAAWEYMAGADLAVSFVPRGPLYDVSSPTKLLEYLALGLPSIGNDIPDQAHVLQSSRAGWLVDGTVEGMAQAALDILRDPAAARRRAAAGPEWIGRERSYAVLAERLAATYRSLASRTVAALRGEAK